MIQFDSKQDRKKAIVLLARAGVHQAEIARRVGLTRERVRQILISEGITARRKHTLLADLDDEVLFGKKPRVLAIELGVEVNHIYAERRRRRILAIRAKRNLGV